MIAEGGTSPRWHGSPRSCCFAGRAVRAGG